MKKVNFWLASTLVGGLAILSSCDRDDGGGPVIDDSFYVTQLGGEVRVQDPANPGQMIEQGFLNLRTVVTNTVVTIAINEGGKYNAVQPYFMFY